MIKYFDIDNFSREVIKINSIRELFRTFCAECWCGFYNLESTHLCSSFAHRAILNAAKSTSVGQLYAQLSQKKITVSRTSNRRKCGSYINSNTLCNPVCIRHSVRGTEHIKICLENCFVLYFPFYKRQTPNHPL